MKPILLTAMLLATAAIAITSTSCNINDNCRSGSGHQVTKTREIAAFDRIEVSDSFKVNIKEDSTSSTLSITADDNLFRYIKTTVTNGKLRIYIKQNVCNSGDMIINVPVKMLSGLKISDGAELVADGKITAKDIFISVSDGAKMTIDLTANHVATTESDSGELNLKGQASSNDIKLSDGSKLNAPDFVTGESNVQSSDGSYAELNILNALSVQSSDGAVVKYHGNPKSVVANKSDGASVEKVN